MGFQKVLLHSPVVTHKEVHTTLLWNVLPCSIMLYTTLYLSIITQHPGPLNVNFAGEHLQTFYSLFLQYHENIVQTREYMNGYDITTQYNDSVSHVIPHNTISMVHL